MRMTPHQMLTALGFNIPEDGIEINEYDFLLHYKSLMLLGISISIDNIDDREISQFHHDIASTVKHHLGYEITQLDDKTKHIIKGIIRANCNITYKLTLKA
ncbi:hypothetical protein AAIA71_28705 (plasmid) [Vibrio harveyi]|uniref:hypothetical protein n=1 Tax=Vibrio harveyi TaxID=669 RepID=UPI0031BA030F